VGQAWEWAQDMTWDLEWDLVDLAWDPVDLEWALE